MGNKLSPWSRDDWYETTWGELVELKYGKALKNYKDATSGFPVYGTNGPVGFNETPLCSHPGIIVGRKGAYRGVHYSPVPFFVIDTAFYIQPRFDINLKWAYYELLQQDINGLDSGSAIPSTRREDFYALQVKIPPRHIQDRICILLDSLNNKVLFNRQINQTLEQMAQALFKSWFVDFDPVVDNALDAGFFEQDLAFPDELLRRAEARRTVREHCDFKPLSEATRQLFPAAFEECAEPSLGLGGWVPKGWQVQSIKDFANVTDYVANGSFAALKDNVTLFDEPEYALYIRTTDFKNDFDKEKAKYVDKHAYDFLSKTKLSGSEVIISNVGDIGTVFRPPYWLGMPMTLGSNAIAVSTQCLNDYLYFYFSSQAGQSSIDGIVSGSAQQKFNKTGFRSLRLLLPSNNIVIKFNEVYQGILLKIISNKQNILYLEKLRDTLLPKLISGELCLDEIEAGMAEEGAA
ncbi:restriction endonuclease subunit S [Aeromonas media]|uniref:restriction endonuclease subunit S n=1 Tax=Aeromonas media TaxID=651 RepID=UPI000FA21BFA